MPSACCRMAASLLTSFSNIPVDCEVYDLFGDLMPAALEEEGRELQWARARQGKVTDFNFLLNTLEGPVPRLAELKVIGAGKTLFPRGEKGLGVVRRAGKLTEEYESVLRGPPWCGGSQSRQQAPWCQGSVLLGACARGSWWLVPGGPFPPTSTSCSGCLPSPGWQPWAGPRGGRPGPTCWAR